MPQNLDSDQRGAGTGAIAAGTVLTQGTYLLPAIITVPDSGALPSPPPSLKDLVLTYLQGTGGAGLEFSANRYPGVVGVIFSKQLATGGDRPTLKYGSALAFSPELVTPPTNLLPGFIESGNEFYRPFTDLDSIVVAVAGGQTDVLIELVCGVGAQECPRIVN